MGIESNGMVLAASVDGGKPILVAFDEPCRREHGCVSKTPNPKVHLPTI